MENLTPEEAYTAMYKFISEYYDRIKSDDYALILGDMSVLPDGSTADPAAWDEWMKAIEEAKAGRVDIRRRTAAGIQF